MEADSVRESSIQAMLRDEREWIRERRKKANISTGDPERDAMGLSFSGGGIRSATFNLGILQAFHKFDVLKKIDYLSTVSGGGFIGSSFTWFKSRDPEGFPFGCSRTDHDRIGGRVLFWLRAYGNYLTPDRTMNSWAFASACLTAILTNLLIVVPVILAIFFLLSREIPLFVLPEFLGILLNRQSLYAGCDGFMVLFFLGLLLLLIFLFRSFLFVVSSRFEPYTNALSQRTHWQSMGKNLWTTVFLFVIALLPVIYTFIQGLLHLVITGISLSGLAALLVGIREIRGRKRSGRMKRLFLPVGLSLLVFGLFMWFYHIANMMDVADYPIVAGLLVLSLVLAYFANINHVSIHRFYRNRLMEAYMPFDIARGRQGDSENYPHATAEDADCCYLANLPQTSAPYHLINATVQTMGSENPKLKRRCGDSFLFSALYCGSACTDFVRTGAYMDGKIDLATACAISGAALDPNTEMTRSRSMSFLITLLNLRSGYWARNPNNKQYKKHLSHPTWYYYIFKDLLGRGLDETCAQVHITDGGHFENLALYELIRRKCRYLVVSDAGADPEWTFQNLSSVIEMVRVDFGAKIILDVSPLKPQGESRISTQPYVTGHVVYNDDSTADLLYIKTCIINELQEDIYGYRRENPDFPDQTTADQFFDEKQFEAYRELGFQIGRRVAIEKLLQW